MERSQSGWTGLSREWQRDQGPPAQKEKGFVCWSFISLSWSQALSFTPPDCLDPHAHSEKLQLLAAISLWVTVGRAFLLPKATPQPPMSPETKATARRKNNITCWCSLVCFGVQKGSSRCKDCSAPLPGNANSPGLHVSGCWIWQCSRLSLRCPPTAGTGRWQTPQCHTQSLCTQAGRWRVGGGHGPGTSSSQAVAAQESCSISRAVHRPRLPQHGAPQGDAVTESLQKPV